MRNIKIFSAVCGLVAFAACAMASGAVTLRVDLRFYPAKDDHSAVVAIVNVDNEHHETAHLEHPGNRGVLSFVVYDDKFNLVSPVGIGKADPLNQKIDVKSDDRYPYVVMPYMKDGKEYLFSFVSGTAWYGYLLEKGKTYRVTAVYRGFGPKADGVASKETLFTY